MAAGVAGSSDETEPKRGIKGGIKEKERERKNETTRREPIDVTM